MRFGRRTVQVGAVVGAGLVMWGTTVVRGTSTPDVLPDTTVEFSLDLEVVAQADAPVVYVVEQRARPGYRIFRFDPVTGEDQTVFTVPENAIIYGIDIDPTGTTLAVAYTPDHNLGGSGLWTLDVATGELVEVVPVAEDVFLTEPEWGADGLTVLATHVDRTGAEEALSVVSVQLADGALEVIAARAVTPAASADAVHYLAAETESSARRTVRSVDLSTGEDVTVASGERDLDHLVVDAGGTFAVAALESDDAAGLSFGAPAEAHGSHDVPSVWWDLDSLDAYEVEPTTTYDAAMVDGVIASVTREGLSIVVDGVKVELIASRALRFITG